MYVSYDSKPIAVILWTVLVLGTIGVIVWFGLRTPDVVGDVEQLMAESKKEVRGVSLFSEFKKDITHVEGRRMEVYWEPISAKLHGGLGHLLTKPELEEYSRGDPLTDEVVDGWFEIDFRKVLVGVAKYFPQFHEYSLHAQIAICNWLYQLGADAPSHFPRATKAIREKDWNRAADEWLYADPHLLRWSKWRNETPHRCEQEAERLRRVAANQVK